MQGSPPPRLVAVGMVLAIVAAIAAASPRPAHASNSHAYTLWSGTPYIANLAVPDQSSTEVGVKFRTDVSGTVTAVRFYKGPGNTGTHVGNLWDTSGNRLATTTFTNETAAGWQQASFANPVAVSAGVTYIASYLAPNGHYAFTTGLSPGDLTAGVDNPPLHALANGVAGPDGVFSYGASSTFPAQGSSTAGNYWVDVVLTATVTTPPVASGLAPANGATGVAQSAQVVAHLSEEVQPATVVFTLTGPGGASVPAQVTWDLHAADRTATLDPAADLAPATTYTAGLSGATDAAGNVMAPVTWSFTTTASAEPAPASIGQWQPVQRWPLVAVHAGVLRTGAVLGWDPTSPTTTSHLYDPSTGSFTAAPMNVDAFCGGLAQMADGRILEAGGDHGDNASATSTYGPAIRAALAFDPSTNVWTRLPDMNLPRWYPAVVRLRDGRMLVVSGQVNSATWADTPEVYDPQSNTWTLLGDVTTSDVHEELYPQAYLLPSGRVLVYAESTGHTWILDVDAQTWTPGPQAPILNASTVQYRPGRILISGGTVGTAGYGSASGAAAAVLDMTAPTPAWQALAPMHFARSYHQLTALPDGRVLAVGGSTVASTGSRSGVGPAEVWDPGSGAWTVMAGAQDPRMNHSVGVLMPDATVLAAGGGVEMNQGSIDYSTAETYTPPYLLSGPRPTLTAAPGAAAYGTTVTVQTPDAASIGSVALIGLSATTHRYDPGATYQSLAFTAGSGQLQVTMPASTGLAPPGFYMLFLVSAAGVPSVAAMVQLTGTDAAPPAVAAAAPPAGSSGASVRSAPAVTFTKPVQPASIQFSLRDSSGATVTTTTGYTTATNRATFTPTALLHYSTTYTATVSAASDVAGNPMAAPFTWTFTTAATPSCPCALWTGSTTPVTTSTYDPRPVELGVKFQAAADGYITALRFYKGAPNTGTHIGNVWTSAGTLLQTATFTGETASGWQSVSFANPVPVSAGTTYVASYFAPNGNYAADVGYFTAGGRESGPLYAPQAGAAGGNGVYTYAGASAFPTSDPPGDDTNYWVDVTFVTTLQSGGPPPAVTATSPAAGATGAPVGTRPSATFSEDVQPSTITMTLTDASGGAVPGSAAYTSVNTTVTFTPSTPLAPATTYTATVSGATDLHGNTMTAPVTWSFTTASPAGCPCTVWAPTATPANPAANDGSAVELGLKFRTDTAGYITGLRFYRGTGNGGAHVGSLWTDTGTRLATATFTNETPTGWQQVAFSSAVGVTAGTNYVVSYFAPQGHYSFDTSYFGASGVDASPLHALQSGVDGPNGVYVYAPSSRYPSTGSGSSANYWVDPVFEPVPDAQAPTVTAESPAGGASGVAASTTVAATFSRAVQPGGLTFVLTDAAGKAVAGTVSYNATTRTATFAPASGLALWTTYTVTVDASDLSGHAMAAPATWSFTTAAPTCPCAIWPATATPATAASGDAKAVELGVKFTSDISGHVTGVRFYKGAGNTGTHVGNLWTSSGQLLATATFTNETASGWQQVTFSSPVAIASGTVYVVSYFAPAGHYAYNSGYFTTSHDNAPLHAVAAASAGGNGIYRYGATSGFPSSTSTANPNYWVDVVLGA